jgi:hypothetical protein
VRVEILKKNNLKDLRNNLKDFIFQNIKHVENLRFKKIRKLNKKFLKEKARRTLTGKVCSYGLRLDDESANVSINQANMMKLLGK